MPASTFDRSLGPQNAANARTYLSLLGRGARDLPELGRGGRDWPSPLSRPYSAEEQAPKTLNLNP